VGLQPTDLVRPDPWASRWKPEDKPGDDVFEEMTGAEWTLL
jgi:hypothetical protein